MDCGWVFRFCMEGLELTVAGYFSPGQLGADKPQQGRLWLTSFSRERALHSEQSALLILPCGERLDCVLYYFFHGLWSISMFMSPLGSLLINCIYLQ